MRHRLVLISALSRSAAALLLLLGGVLPLGGAFIPGSAARADAAPEIVSRWPNRPAPARGETLLRQVMLDRHNAARRAAGAPPMVWDPALAGAAGDYAARLARSGRFEHARQDGRSGYQGENLWRGTRGAFSYQEMVDAWIDERADYRPGPVPGNSRSGNWGGVAHYTQIIWRSTDRVGCAIAEDAGSEYLVCRYSPAGNVYGRDPTID